MTLQIDRPYLVETLRGLVQINSINPDLAPGGPGEAAAAAYLADAMTDLGLAVITHEPKPGRVSVVGVLKGTGQGRSLMVNGHIDTVGVSGMDQPFSAHIDGNRLYGRGAFDMKGGVVAAIAAAKALRDAGQTLGGDLVIAAVADEEYASVGTVDLLPQYPVDGAIVTEPTGLEICLAHKGFIWLEVETVGRAAHGSRFDLGIDANMRMGRFLAELEKLEQSLRRQEGHPLVGPPSLHAARIQGGSALSAYAAKCRLQIERRTIPGETTAQVEAEIQAILDRLAATDPTFQASLRTLFARDPFEISPQASIVQTLHRAVSRILGREPVYAGQNPWMDSAFLAAAGIETVVIGPGGTGAHADEEWVDLDSVAELALILAETAQLYCRVQS